MPTCSLTSRSSDLNPGPYCCSSTARQALHWGSSSCTISAMYAVSRVPGRASRSGGSSKEYQPCSRPSLQHHEALRCLGDHRTMGIILGCSLLPSTTAWRSGRGRCALYSLSLC